MKFIHCYVGYPGSVHDQRVFGVSGLEDFCSDPAKFPNNTDLIGDAAYKIQKSLLVPYKDNGRLTDRQTNYNYCLSSTRMIVEQFNWSLKITVSNSVRQVTCKKNRSYSELYYGMLCFA